MGPTSNGKERRLRVQGPSGTKPRMSPPSRATRNFRPFAKSVWVRVAVIDRLYARNGIQTRHCSFEQIPMPVQGQLQLICATLRLDILKLAYANLRLLDALPAPQPTPGSRPPGGLNFFVSGPQAATVSSSRIACSLHLPRTHRLYAADCHSAALPRYPPPLHGSVPSPAPGPALRLRGARFHQGGLLPARLQGDAVSASTRLAAPGSRRGACPAGGGRARCATRGSSPTPTPTGIGGPGTQITTAVFGLAPADFDLFLGLYTYLKRLPELPKDGRTYLTVDFLARQLTLPADLPEGSTCGSAAASSASPT